ncbi:DUF6463 family protein [Mastigocoleus testarum]|uniref:Molecular chaperone GroEL n=1 Tax=Mastigocoleus testarum BC008 TaxID=371196 RepID=A0A0V7ZK48_9CYAN|nr:DUF6463 family protein [Mastigocoleus testarum]KST64972.1 hypothetical protein BC008_19395 [Mastigocoleus testarum BC008]KST64980.1 hypothetical protein BC008_19410 [Mastigocoleus testarum BC008]
MLQFSGYWLLVTSFIHIIVGFWVYGEPLAEIVSDGFFNSVAPNPFAPNFAREDAFWFMTLTAFFVILAQLCFWAHFRKIALPESIGWTLLITSIIGAIAIPISGFWLLMVPAILIIAASKNVSNLDIKCQKTEL